MDGISDLAFFALLVKRGSLAAAAQELGVTPPSVSKRLACLLYTSPSPRDQRGSRMPSSA